MAAIFDSAINQAESGLGAVLETMSIFDLFPVGWISRQPMSGGGNRKTRRKDWQLHECTQPLPIGATYQEILAN